MPTNNLLSPPLSQESIFCSLLALSTLNNSVELYCKESRTYFYRIHNESKTATIKQLAGEILLLSDQLGNLPNLYTTQYNTIKSYSYSSEKSNFPVLIVNCYKQLELGNYFYLDNPQNIKNYFSVEKSVSIASSCDGAAPPSAPASGV